MLYRYHFNHTILPPITSKITNFTVVVHGINQCNQTYYHLASWLIGIIIGCTTLFNLKSAHLRNTHYA